MRSTWLQGLTMFSAAMVVPAMVFGHPGHPGHEVPVGPYTGEDCLTGVVIVLGMMVARSVWRHVRQGDRRQA